MACPDHARTIHACCMQTVLTPRRHDARNQSHCPQARHVVGMAAAGADFRFGNQGHHCRPPQTEDHACAQAAGQVSRSRATAKRRGTGQASRKKYPGRRRQCEYACEAGAVHRGTRALRGPAGEAHSARRTGSGTGCESGLAQGSRKAVDRAQGNQECARLRCTAGNRSVGRRQQSMERSRTGTGNIAPNRQRQLTWPTQGSGAHPTERSRPSRPRWVTRSPQSGPSRQQVDRRHHAEWVAADGT